MRRSACSFALVGVVGFVGACANDLVDDDEGDANVEGAVVGEVTDPDRETEVSTVDQPVTCGAQVRVFPVRGRHNVGYDSTAGDHGQWTCNAGHSNSDFVAGDHLGNDIWAAEGTDVVATVNGTLELTAPGSQPGLWIGVSRRRRRAAAGRRRRLRPTGRAGRTRGPA